MVFAILSHESPMGIYVFPILTLPFFSILKPQKLKPISIFIKPQTKITKHSVPYEYHSERPFLHYLLWPLNNMISFTCYYFYMHKMLLQKNKPKTNKQENPKKNNMAIALYLVLIIWLTCTLLMTLI